MITGMSPNDIASAYSDLRHLALADMTDEQLSLWLRGCVVIEPHAKTDAARQLWHDRGIEAAAEVERWNA